MEATTTRRRRTVKPITQSLKRYTMDEINAMIDESERDIAEGRVYDFDDTMDELEEKFTDMDKELYTPEEAYELTMKDIIFFAKDLKDSKEDWRWRQWEILKILLIPRNSMSVGE